MEHIKQNKRLVICVVAVCAAVVIAIAGLSYYNSQPGVRYQRAEDAYAAGNYEKALKYYTLAGDYLDSARKAADAQLAVSYKEAVDLMAAGSYEEAAPLLESVGDYEDAATLLEECEYNIGLSYLEAGEYEQAAEALIKAPGVEDARERSIEALQGLVEQGEYQTAVTLSRNIKMSSENAYVHYAKGQVFMDAGNYEEAKAQFKLAGDILDAADMYTEARYQYGMNLLDHKQYGDARNTFKDLEDYKDAATLADAAILLMAQDQMADGELLDAQNNLKRLPSDYTYDGVSVSDLSAQLSENQRWVDITGDLKVNSGEMTTDCLYKRDSHSMGEWTLAADTLDISMNVKCRIGDDGKVTIVIYGYLPYFTEWSTLSALVDFDLQEIDVTKELNASDIGKSISIDDNTTFTVLEDGIRFHYYKKETNKDTIFDYEYETDMTYKR